MDVIKCTKCGDEFIRHREPLFKGKQRTKCWHCIGKNPALEIEMKTLFIAEAKKEMKLLNKRIADGAKINAALTSEQIRQIEQDEKQEMRRRSDITQSEKQKPWRFA
jgi:hypothetical protein